MKTFPNLRSLMAALILSATLAAGAKTIEVNLTALGVKPDTQKSQTLNLRRAITKAMSRQNPGDTLLMHLAPGTYHFSPAKELRRTLFISNHDQDNPKNVGIELNSCTNIILDGNGADLRFDGRMLPIVMTATTDCQLRNLSIDFTNPQISQVTILNNDTIRGIITYRPAEYVKYRITTDSTLIAYGNGWEQQPIVGIAFDPRTRHMIYNTSDINVGTSSVTPLPDGSLQAPWRDPRLPAGTIVAMRSYARPCPAIFIDESRDIALTNVTVHYAEGMGLLAQNTCNIALNGFNVSLRGDSDPRYFTTQADATHFSGCSGTITSIGGLYEAMMDDAINVHGTYLKLTSRIDDNTFEAAYQHPQTYGFRWANPGDSVAVISSPTMDIAQTPLTIASITPVDQPTVSGAKVFRIRFNETVDISIDPDRGSFGFENLTATPSVRFADNTIRNNRARGALFSTPRPVMVENNLFDHTSGSAILLCGDCNGWYETGACRNVTIRSNRFINALTNLFQFTNAVISIYPEIPDLLGQHGYFHSGITIVDNHFDTFDAPLLYAKSVDGLLFRHNTLSTNHDFPPLHWNRSQILLHRVTNAAIDPVTNPASN